jgi:hypothetical protein
LQPVDEHSRAARALVEREAHLLDESESAWLSGHLAGCEACRRMSDDLAETRGQLRDDNRHLPTRVLSRWDTEFGRLPDLAREHALAHLESCEMCRGALRVAGHPLPAEITNRSSESPSRVPIDGTARKVIPVPRAPWWVSMWREPWVIGSGLAAAAGFMIFASIVPHVPETPSMRPAPVVTKPGTPAVSVRPAPIPAVPVPTPPAAEPQLSVSLSSGDPGEETIARISLDRPRDRSAGGAAPAPAIDLPRGAHAIRMAHPEGVLLLDDRDDPFTLEVTRPSGGIARFTGRIADLQADRPLVLRWRGDAEPGLYHFVYTFGGASTEAPLSGEFKVSVH